MRFATKTRYTEINQSRPAMRKFLAKIFLGLFIITPLLFFTASKISNLTNTQAALIDECNDGEDNDGDGLIDGNDPGCVNDPDLVGARDEILDTGTCELRVWAQGDYIEDQPVTVSVDVAYSGTYRVYVNNQDPQDQYSSGSSLKFTLSGTLFPTPGTYSITAQRQGDLSDPNVPCANSPQTITVTAPPVKLTVTGPNGEDQNNLPSRQPDRDIWYDVKVTGLEPDTGYHFQFYKLSGYQPGVDGEDGGGIIADGVDDSVCGYVYYDSIGFTKEATANSKGEINLKYPDKNIPTDTSYFIFEVATSTVTYEFPFGDDCVRDKYVDHIQIRIVDTPSNYVPGVPGYFPVIGRNPCEVDTQGNPISYCPTALGNITPTIGAFAGKFLTLGIGIAGGIALILMVIGAIRIITAAGDPKSVAAGREMIIAAIAGLLFLVFSVVILNFLVGPDFLYLPGFGGFIP